MIIGQPKFNTIALGELTATFTGTTLHVEGKAAFADQRTGQTHGWTKNTQWSHATIEKLKELKALMEVDLGHLHLEGGGESVVGPQSLGTAGRGISMGAGGLGEHLGNEPPSL